MFGAAQQGPALAVAAAHLHLRQIGAALAGEEIATEQAIAGIAVVMPAIVEHGMGFDHAVGRGDAQLGTRDAPRRLAQQGRLELVHRGELGGEAEALAQLLALVGLVGREFGALVALDQHETSRRNASFGAQLQRPLAVRHLVEFVVIGGVQGLFQPEFRRLCAIGHGVRGLGLALAGATQFGLPGLVITTEYQESRATVLHRQRALPGLAASLVGAQLDRQQGSLGMDRGLDRIGRGHGGKLVGRTRELLRNQRGLRKGTERQGRQDGDGQTTTQHVSLPRDERTIRIEWAASARPPRSVLHALRSRCAPMHRAPNRTGGVRAS